MTKKCGDVVAIDFNTGRRTDLIGFLEHLIGEVKAGRVDGIGIALVLSKDRGIGTYFDFAEDKERPFSMIGALRYLERRLCQSFLDDEDD